MNNHYDIGVIGFWYSSNYGSLLNGYATYKILKSFGCSPLMINKPDASADDWELNNTHNARFIQKYYDENEISPCYPYDKMYELNKICDAFCAGPDPIWNHNFSFKMATFLNFAVTDKKKISFASSFGHANEKTPQDKKEEIKKLLRRFDAISVREPTGVKICESYGIRADEVLEPLFCIDEKYYNKLAEQAKFNETEPYMLTYILNSTPEKRKAIQFYGEKLELKTINILDGVPHKFTQNKAILDLPNILEDVNAEDFIKAFMNASFVITDSYHGTAFSIIFNKPFISITNPGSGAIDELLSKFDLTHRLIPDPQNIPEDEEYLTPIDFFLPNKVIIKERRRTVDWFRNAVETPKEKTHIFADEVTNNTIEEYYKDKRYDVGVMGFWWGGNYGSVLNGYATCQNLKSLGVKPLMIDKPDAKSDDWELVGTHNTKFIRQFYEKDEISPCMPYERMHELNKICDAFCAGSDQIWNYKQTFGNTMFLNFADDSKKKISYASSFGYSVDFTPDEEKRITEKLLKRFDAISVREQDGVDRCKGYGVHADIVQEPVFNIDVNIYHKIAEHSKFNADSPYLLTYILDPSPEKRKAIQYYGKKTGLKVINILDGQYDWEKNSFILDLPNILSNVCVEDFIKAFINSSFVITDSFHGSSFSIIFQKPFIAIKNHWRGATRFDNLLGRFNLTDRLVHDPDNIPEDDTFLKEVDFTYSHNLLINERKRSVDWLKNAVETPKK